MSETIPAQSGGSGPDATAEPLEVDGMLSFACPRCHRDVSEELYGPCTECRTTLRAVIGAEARDVDTGDYVPKMNVTPNAVATKD